MSHLLVMGVCFIWSGILEYEPTYITEQQLYIVDV